MQKNNILYVLSCCIIFCSCKGIKNLSSKDHSTIVSKSGSKKTAGEVKFLDDITVKPPKVTGHKQNTAIKTKKQSTIGSTDSEFINAGFNIEKADWLQIKYAIVLDATIEKLSNMPLLQTIDNWWGTRYCMGGHTQSCIDCSAFTQTVLKDVYNISLPRTAQDQYKASERVELEDLKEGDLVFFHTGGGRSISHVGVYLLNNKFVHAATSKGVMVSDLNENYWRTRYRGAGRVSVSLASAK